MAIDPERLRKAMMKKGFTAREGGNHTRFALQYSTPGKLPVTTVLSRGGHGKSIIGPALESRMRKELGFDNVEQLRLYAKCDLTEAEYVDVLKRNGTLNRKRR